MKTPHLRELTDGCSWSCSWGPCCENSQQGMLPKLRGCMGTGRDPDRSPTYPCCSAQLCHNSKYPYQTLWSCLSGEKKTKPNLTQPTSNKTNHKKKHDKKTSCVHHCLVPTCLKNQGNCSRDLPVTTVWWQGWGSLASWCDFAIPFLSALTIR